VTNGARALAARVNLPHQANVAALANFFDRDIHRDTYIAFIRPDHIAAAITDPAQPPTSSSSPPYIETPSNIRAP
jgi:hypothetical protein